jgi:hypothetical protein
MAQYEKEIAGLKSSSL